MSPFISGLPKFIDIKNGSTFFQYFDQKGYMEQFSGMSCFEDFAEKLLKSSQFVHLCDDCDNEDFNNFMMLNSILNQRPVKQNSDLPEGLDLNIIGLKETKSLPLKLETNKPLEITFRVPSYKKRLLLFEKLLFLIEQDVKSVSYTHLTLPTIYSV